MSTNVQAEVMTYVKSVLLENVVDCISTDEFIAFKPPPEFADIVEDSKLIPPNDTQIPPANK